jgi:hypothetical protein
MLSMLVTVCHANRRAGAGYTPCQSSVSALPPARDHKRSRYTRTVRKGGRSGIYYTRNVLTLRNKQEREGRAGQGAGYTQETQKKVQGTGYNYLHT